MRATLLAVLACVAAIAWSSVQAQVDVRDQLPAEFRELPVEVQAEIARQIRISFTGTQFENPGLLRVGNRVVPVIFDLSDPQAVALELPLRTLERALLDLRGEAVLALGTQQGAIFTVQGLRRVLAGGLDTGDPSFASGLIPVSSLTQAQRGVLEGSLLDLGRAFNDLRGQAADLLGQRRGLRLSVETIDQILGAPHPVRIIGAADGRLRFDPESVQAFENQVRDAMGRLRGELGPRADRFEGEIRRQIESARAEALRQANNLDPQVRNTPGTGLFTRLRPGTGDPTLSRDNPGVNDDTRLRPGTGDDTLSRDNPGVNDVSRLRPGTGDDTLSRDESGTGFVTRARPGTGNAVVSPTNPGTGNRGFSNRTTAGTGPSIRGQSTRTTAGTGPSTRGQSTRTTAGTGSRGFSTRTTAGTGSRGFSSRTSPGTGF
jgi:hypothetical protein